MQGINAVSLVDRSDSRYLSTADSAGDHSNRLAYHGYIPAVEEDIV